ncbi:MAG: hypothetical protein K2P52_08620 [Campylobacterales bacterium]|nr:hypothetical protein [Campylobacterales bacterium]
MLSLYEGLSSKYKYPSNIFFDKLIIENFKWVKIDKTLHDDTCSVIIYQLDMSNIGYKIVEPKLIGAMYLSEYQKGRFLLFEEYWAGPGAKVLFESNDIELLKFKSFEYLSKIVKHKK